MHEPGGHHAYFEFIPHANLPQPTKIAYANNEMDTFTQSWNKNHKELRHLLSKRGWCQPAITLFQEQHRVLHSASLAAEMEGDTTILSLEDDLFFGITDDQFRLVPKGEVHSIAWVIWHIARIEDITMNMLVAERYQVLEEGDWASKIGTEIYHTGNAVDAAGVARLSSAVDIDALRAYRLAVGRETRQIVSKLEPVDLNRKPDPEKLALILAKGAVIEEARGIVEYWGKRTIAELLLMPPTRHNLVHLNEAHRLKNRRS